MDKELAKSMTDKELHGLIRYQYELTGRPPDIALVEELFKRDPDLGELITVCALRMIEDISEDLIKEAVIARFIGKPRGVA